MKYIRTFEDKKDIPEPKFEKGQWVKIFTLIDDSRIWESPPYEIVNREYNEFSTPRYWEYCLDTITGGRIWRKESILELVPDYELAAMKYNL